MEAEAILEGSAYVMAASFIAAIPRFLTALAFLFLTWLIVKIGNRLFRPVLKRTRMRRALIELVIEITDAVVWVVAFFIAAGLAFPSVTPASILTGLGLGTVAIGFAFRDILENFLAGTLILYREPFRLGDCIECGGTEGFVEEVTSRDTHVRRTDGQRVVLPNAMLLKEQVTVRTDRDVRRTTILCRVAFHADVDAARRVMRAAVTGLPSVIPDREVQIFAQGFAESGIEFEVTWWCRPLPVDIRRSRDEVIGAVKRALDDAGIPLAVPRRSLSYLTQTRPDPQKEREA